MTDFKPQNYNSVSPYLIVNDAPRYIKLLTIIFGATKLREYNRENGIIKHAELLIDDSIIMLAEATNEYPPQPTMIHVYVPDAQTAFNTAIAAGCTCIEEPKQSNEDPDVRGMFQDYMGIIWAVGTQSKSHWCIIAITKKLLINSYCKYSCLKGNAVRVVGRDVLIVDQTLQSGLGK